MLGIKLYSTVVAVGKSVHLTVTYCAQCAVGLETDLNVVSLYPEPKGSWQPSCLRPCWEGPIYWGLYTEA